MALETTIGIRNAKPEYSIQETSGALRMHSAFLGIIALNIVVLSVPATMVVITITNAIIVVLTELRLKFWIVAAGGANGLLMLTHP